MAVSWSILERRNDAVLHGYAEIVVIDVGREGVGELLALVDRQASYWRREFTGSLPDERVVHMRFQLRTREASADENRYVMRVAGEVIDRLHETEDSFISDMVVHQMPAAVQDAFARVAAMSRGAPDRALNYVIPYGVPVRRGDEYELASCVTSGVVLLYSEPDRRNDRVHERTNHSCTHEIGHLLGLSDLYRVGPDGNPECLRGYETNIMCAHDTLPDPAVGGRQVREAAEFAVGEALRQQRHPMAVFETFRHRFFTAWTPYHVREYRDEGSPRNGMANITW